MWEQLTYTNSLGESAVVATNSAIYRLSKKDFKPVRDRPRTSHGYRQDGETYEGSDAQAADLVYSFIIFGNGYSDIFQKRMALERIFSPKLSPGTLKYQNDYLTAGVVRTVKIDQSPAFGTGKKNIGYHSSMCGISMTAHDPYWKDAVYTEIQLVGLINPFYWDTPEYFDGSFYMGGASASSKVASNIGHVPAPLMFEWQGVSENPKLTLEDTGEFILINSVLDSDTKLHIYTAYGQKSVYVETLSTGAIVKDNSLIGTGSTFFSLPVGNSTISLTADDGAATAAVTMKYKNLYMGVGA